MVVTGSLPFVPPYGINTGVMLFDGNKYRTSTFLKDVSETVASSPSVCVLSIPILHLISYFSCVAGQIDNAIESYGIEEFRDRHARLPVSQFPLYQQWFDGILLWTIVILPAGCLGWGSGCVQRLLP